jgi:enterochelin esterase-like enzyme
MLEPQSTLLFVILAVGFGALMWWIVRTRWIAVRVGAAVLAFVVAAGVGILAVNRFYDYYPTWGAAISDLSGTGTGGLQVSDSSLVARPWRKVLAGAGPGALAGHAVYLGLAERQGYTLGVKLPGPRSHINRNAYIYLPPQYFQSSYRDYRFPVIELIHGEPGEPQDWINVAGVTQSLNQLVSQGLARPVVLVMPDANGGLGNSLQCLNQVHGPQDMTYLAQDVPNDVTHMLRVQPQGPAWGLAGYSEGGFCAANMALHFRRSYGFAGVLSGYFSPTWNQVNGRAVNPFGRNAALRALNTPAEVVRKLKPGAYLPQFWLAAGRSDAQDVANAEYFSQELQNHQASVPVFLSAGGHTMEAWRDAIPALLEWMTGGLAHEVVRMHALEVAAHKAALCGVHPASTPSPSVKPSAHSSGHVSRPAGQAKAPRVHCPPVVKHHAGVRPGP